MTFLLIYTFGSGYCSVARLHSHMHPHSQLLASIGDGRWCHLVVAHRVCATALTGKADGGRRGFSGGRSLFSSAFLPAHRRPASGRRGPPDGRAPGVASPCAVHPGDEAAVAGAGR